MKKIITLITTILMGFNCLSQTASWSTIANTSTTYTNYIGNVGNFSLRFKTNNLQRVIFDSTGKIGIGTNNPTATLHTVGSFRYVDGNQAVGKFLMSNVRGDATWSTVPVIDTTKYWKLNGNVVGYGSFLGSTNNASLKIRTNNRVRQKNDSLGNIIFFKKAGTSNYDTLFSIRKDGYVNAGGSINYGSLSIGRNTGFDSGLVHNTFVGYDCAGTNGEDTRLTKSLTTGYRNTGFGAIVMRRLTTGSFNTAVGDEAMEFSEDAQYNTAIGRFGQNANKSSNNNTSLGYNSLAGQFRTVSGNLQPCNTFPMNSIAIGYSCLNQDTVTDENCGGGYLSAQYLIGGTDNAFWGNSIMSLAATTPNRNAIFGNHSGESITSASDNALLGYNAGNRINTGNKNTDLGRSAGEHITGNENVNIGYLSAQLFTGDVSVNGMINIGAYSGRYDARSNVGHIGNQDNGSQALDTTNSIAYFIMDANPLNQRWKFNSKLSIVDGSQGANKVFTSDANGVGRWSTPSSSGTSGYLHSISTPTTGATVSLVNNQYNIINPSGALLAVTVNLPSSPSNNDVVYIKFTKVITTVTYANGTVVDGITSPVAGGLVILVYDSGTSSWY